MARGFAGDIEHLTQLIKRGIRHPGLAHIDILQPCVTFNHRNTARWYRERIYKLEGASGYDPGNRQQAMEKAQEWGERIPIGVIYEQPRPSFEDSLPALKQRSLVRQPIEPARVEALLKGLG